MKMKHALLASLLLAGTSGAAFAQMASSPADTVMVGGAAMYPTKNIVENAVNSKDNTTLVAAVKAAGLVSALEGPGPFTVFAPTNAAFAELPAGTVATLLKPENKAKLASILEYHVVKGKFDFSTLAAMIQGDGGKATLPTLMGKSLTFTMNGPHNIVVTDDHGNTAQIETYDVFQSNGVIQVIDHVLLP
ncbi:MAG: fasciclin [Rhodospirillales bacterium 20-60-12]|nr:MAG: fasciclin [Rhodospirillales bacterium 20-60-12]HQT67548.1 fasciclin domain-containing protein [Acetobacteraceae bacterium]